QPPFAQNGTVVNLRMSTRFCTKGDGFQFLAKFAILPQNANSLYFFWHKNEKYFYDNDICHITNEANT
ncbi:hypothetical protein, partial [Klebsiella pneumoniae]|uniref:hypothetical protein n=1 Tax=Klebsiella pneumoniae TaxID=573 RepID=UPI001D0DF5DB